MKRLVAAAALLFLLVHLRALPQTLEDIDSINFALGVEQFDVASHRPHPPGYPIFIGLAKMSTAVIGFVEPTWDRDHRAAAGLAVWSIVAGALGVFVLAEFWVALGLTPTLAALASLATVASPLYWLTSSRPLTDIPGLVAALAAQTALLNGWRQIRGGASGLPKAWLWGAAASGFIIGLRSQTMWQTGPILFWVAGELLMKRRGRDVLATIAAAAVGALAWAVPLVWVSGGITKYMHALESQGVQDFSGVEMFVTTPTWKLFRTAMDRTFIQPWLVAGLANAIIGFALVGFARLAWRGRGVLAAIVISFWPYLVFHVMFHETNTIRYDLPVLVAVVGLAVIGLAALGVRVAMAGATVAIAVSLVLGQPRLLAYADGGAPVFRAFQDMHRAAASQSEQPVLRMHHQVWWGVARAVDWYKPVWAIPFTDHPGDREWRAVVRHFVGGGTAPVWYLTDLARNDVFLFDPRHRSLGGRYALDPAIRQLVGGSRLDGLAWWRIDRPFWLLGSGWSLTPEVAGMTAADLAAPHQRAAEAFLRRGGGPARVMVGGRYLGGAGAAIVSAELDGKPLAEWLVAGDPRWFVQWIELPDGVPAGASPYALLEVRVRAAQAGQPSPVIGLEQFDEAPVTEAISAFADGWQEFEEDPRTGRLWRWMGEHGTIVVRGGAGDLTLDLAGDSPLRYFDRAPTVTVRAGDRELARLRPSADFTPQVAIPRRALDAAGGRITIDTDLTFVPGQKTHSPDQRTLGLKLFKVEIRN